MNVVIRRAERKKAKLRIGTSGPSGSGKTYSALLIASGISPWEKVILIDTENGSGELYSNLGAYNVITLQAPFSPEKYVEAIKAAEEAGMETIIIDSISHEWDGKGGCLESNDLIAQTKFRGNSFMAWSVTTPRHQRFIEAITTSSCHIITTARSKTDMMQTEDKKIKKVGTKEIQREGFEYELTCNFTLDREGHYAIASKDRTGLFIERDPFVITKKLGDELLKWNNSGADLPPPPPPVDPLAAKKKRIFVQLKMLGADVSTIESVTASVKKLVWLDLEPASFDEIMLRLEALVIERKKTGTTFPINPPKETVPPINEEDLEPIEDVMSDEIGDEESLQALSDEQEEQEEISAEDAEALQGTFAEDDPNRPHTKENLDGSIDLISPDGKKKRVKNVAKVAEIKPAEKAK